MSRKISIIQGILQMLIGISAVFGGLSLVMEPTGEILSMPLDLLVGSPFNNFFIPGLILLVVNGLGNMYGSIITFQRKSYSGHLGIALGLIMVIWIAVQVAMVGLVNWLQPFYLVLGVLETGLGSIIYKGSVK
jgi:hypothetical protein